MAGLLDFLKNLGGNGQMPAGGMGAQPSAMGAGTPGAMRRGPDGKMYQYAETTGMARDDGSGQGWLQTNMGGGGMFGGLSRFNENNPALLMGLGDVIAGRDPRDTIMQGQQIKATRKRQNATRAYLVKNGYSEEEADMIMGADPQILAQALKPKGGGNYINAGDGQLFNQDTGEWITAPNAGGNDYQVRQTMAEQYGLKPEDPGYQSFILTGKMPREDQAPLTATDKKAILEADEMVSVNESAIAALEQAEKLSDKANSGWFAGMRASAGNNLPDVMVPDGVSSPESSAATADMDNAVVGQALTSLKAIFGGAPTEGERKILLELQGSSSMPRQVRKQVFARARALAERRLEFNRQRAASLRGGDFYKPGNQQQQAAPAQGGGGYTILGVEE